MRITRFLALHRDGRAYRRAWLARRRIDWRAADDSSAYSARAGASTGAAEKRINRRSALMARADLSMSAMAEADGGDLPDLFSIFYK